MPGFIFGFWLIVNQHILRPVTGSSSRSRIRRQRDVARSKQTLIPTDKRLSLPRTRVAAFYCFVFFFLVQLNVSDEDIRTFSYLIGSLIYDPRASAGTCLWSRREYSPAQFNRSADDGSAVIAVIFPCLRNITLDRGILSGIINV